MFTLEAAYEESDQSKAKRSDHSFKPEIHWEIPLANIVLHDNPDGEIRSLTVREGSKFVFTGREYLVRTIRPDHIDVCLSASPNSVETWLLSETPRENP
jgi:lipocalin